MLPFLASGILIEKGAYKQKLSYENIGEIMCVKFLFDFKEYFDFFKEYFENIFCF